MDSLRRPLFFVALALIAIAVLVEIGATGVLSLSAGAAPPANAQALADAQGLGVTLDAGQNDKLNQLALHGKPPGLGILYLAFLDAVVLFTVGLMGASLIVPERIQGRIQGCATLLFGVLLLLAIIVAIFIAINLLTLMLSLLLGVPFGTIVYLALFGTFDTGGAAIVLSLLMLLKLGFAAVLPFAHQRFLQNKGLIMLTLCSLLATIIVTFLHSLVPGILVSITDALAAIIVAAIAVIWLILLLFGSLGSILSAVRPKV